jgi:hypothetical protein
LGDLGSVEVVSKFLGDFKKCKLRSFQEFAIYDQEDDVLLSLFPRGVEMIERFVNIYKNPTTLETSVNTPTTLETSVPNPTTLETSVNINPTEHNKKTNLKKTNNQQEEQDDNSESDNKTNENKEESNLPKLFIALGVGVPVFVGIFVFVFFKFRRPVKK